MGSTENVSWNKPFGNSYASNLVGGEAGTNHIMDNVSMQHPIGQGSELAVQTGAGQRPESAVAKAQRLAREANTGGGQAQAGGYGGLSSAGNGMNTGPWSEGNKSTGGEDAFRADYLSSLKPNTAFTFNAENPNTFGGKGGTPLAGGAKTNTPVGGV
jgi:hypothetical protein